MNKITKVLFGKKEGMTSLISEDGELINVTVLSVLESDVIYKKNIETDGYVATVCGYKKEDNINKPKQGLFSKYKKDNYKKIYECRDLELDSISIDQFEENEIIKIKSVSKGKGFQGTIKRHGFARGPKTHGSKSYRIPGSIGQCSTPSKVMKGKKMAGQTGSDLITAKSKIIKIDPDNNLVFLKGSVAGSKNSDVILVGVS